MSFIIQYHTAGLRYAKIPCLNLKGIISIDGHLYWLLKDVLKLIDPTAPKPWSNLKVSDVTGFKGKPGHGFRVAKRHLLFQDVISHLQMTKLLEKSKCLQVRQFCKQINNRNAIVRVIRQQDPGQFYKPTRLRMLHGEQQQQQQLMSPTEIIKFLEDVDEPTPFFTWLGYFTNRVSLLNVIILFDSFFKKKLMNTLSDEMILFKVMKEMYGFQINATMEIEAAIFPPVLTVVNGSVSMQYVLVEQWDE